MMLAGCGSSGGPAQTSPSTRSLPGAAEPAKPGEPSVPPTGTVLALPGGSPEGIVADAKTGLVAVALRGPNRLALVDGASLTLRKVVPVPGSARHLNLVAPGGPVLVPGEDTDLLAEVSLPEGTVTSSVKVGRQPHDAIAADGSIFAADEFGSNVAVVRDAKLVRTLPGPVQPGGVAATEGRVGAVDVRGALVYVYDTSTLTSVGTAKAGAGPSHDITIAPGVVAVADTRGNAVLLVSLTGKPRLIATIPLPGVPYGLAVDDVRHRLYVTLTARNELVRFAIASNGGLRKIDTVPTVRAPYSVAVDTKTGRVFVAGITDAQLQAIDP